MYRDTKEYTLYDGVTPVAVTSSTDATPIVVTATSHGLASTDKVLIFGHTTNVAANGIYNVTRVTANTFQLQDRNTDSDVAGSGAGAGSGGLLIPNPKILLVEDYRNIVLHVITAGTATLTLKVAGSLGHVLGDESGGHGDTPNFAATQSAANPYSYVDIVNLEDGAIVEGDTGIAVAGTDIHRTYEVNTNGLKYLCVFPTAFTQGNITIKAQLFSNQ